MLLNGTVCHVLGGILCRVEPFDCAIALQSLTPLCCTLFSLNSYSSYCETCVKLSEGIFTTYMYIIYCDSRPGCLIRTVCNYSTMNVASYHRYLIYICQALSEIAMRNLFVCLDMFLRFLHQFDGAFVRL